MSPAVGSSPTRVGSIRPSQAIHSYGVGSLVDLPNLSVIVGGLDRWDTTKQDGQPRRYLDVSRARAALGFEAHIPLADGLAETVAWFRANRPASV